MKVVGVHVLASGLMQGMEKFTDILRATGYARGAGGGGGMIRRTENNTKGEA